VTPLRAALALAVGLLPGLAAESRAQESPPDSVAVVDAAPPSPTPERRPYRSFRFRGGPREVCSSFLLTEFSWMRRVGGTGRASSDERMYASLDLGWAKNVGSAYAVGGTVFLGGDNTREHLGVRARVRRWLKPNLSLDLSPGVILAGEERDHAAVICPGFIAQASVMADDRLGVVGQVFATRARESRTVPLPGGSGTATRTVAIHETGWAAGVKLGSGLGVAATAVVLVLGMIFVISNTPGGF
jgi:hypothetical protein